MLSNALNDQRSLGSRIDNWLKSLSARRLVEIVVAVTVGAILGILVLFSRELPANWRGLILLAATVPTAVLVVGNLDKLILIVLVIDIPLGLDIALSNQEGFSGGLSGYVISLMSIALIVGYARWLATGSAHRQLKINPHWDITVPALVYLLFILVSAFNAINMKFSFFSIFLHLQFFLMYFYLINHVNDRADLRLIFTVLIVAVLLESLLMLLQYQTGFKLSFLSIAGRAYESDITSARARVGGTLGSPNIAATFLAASLAMIYAVHMSNKSFVRKGLALTALLLGIVALLATQSRMGWIICAVALMIVTAVAFWRRHKLSVLWPLLIITLVVGAGFSRQIADRFTGNDRESALSRIWYNELAFNVIEDNMLTGIGANNQRFIIDDVDYIPLELLGRERTLIHNKYLSTWAEIGILGILALLWLLAAGVRRALLSIIRTNSTSLSIIMAGLLGALVAYSMHMLVATFTGRVRLQLLWLLLALIAATSQIMKESTGADAHLQ